MRASDGALYGTASEGGDFSSGILFRLFSGLPQITINKIQIGGAGAFLNFSGGAAGQNYQIEASTTLGARASWDILGSTTAAIDGQFQFLDPVASNNTMRFYRTAIR